MPLPRRSLSRRQFLTALGSAGAAATLGACGGSGGSGSSGSSAPAAGASGSPSLSGEITFSMWAGFDDELAAFKTVVASFEKATGARVKLEQLPYEQFRQTIDSRLQANKAPDVFRVTYTEIGTYTSGGALADISSYLGDGFGDQFVPALWAAVNPEDKPVGVPHHTDVSALIYNKDHFAKAGIKDVPQTLDSAWSWEQFQENLQKLKAAKVGGYPFAMNYQLFGAYRWLNWLYQAGGSLLDDNLEKVTLDSPQARRALDFTKGLYTQGLHAPNILIKRPSYPDEIFPSQKLSVISAGDFLIPQLQDNVKKKFPYGATFLPKDVQATTDLGGNAVVVTEQSKNKELAAAFAKHLVTAENMRTFCEKAVVLPVRKDLVDTQLDYAVRPDLMPVYQQQAKTLPEKLVKVSTSANFAGINDALVQGLEDFYASGKSTDQTIAELSSSIQKAVDS